MCRWLAYPGTPIRLGKPRYRPRRSSIDQSMRSGLGMETTNGPAFRRRPHRDVDRPAVCRVLPCWC